MTTITVDWPDFGRLDQCLTALADFDAMPLMERWADIVVEGNRRGVLSGLDGHDRPMPPLKYRDGKGRPTANRKAGLYGTTAHGTTGRGPYATGLHDNLTTRQYQDLAGPRLAPRREQSRAVTNLHTEIRHPAPDVWEVVGAWLEVVSEDGVSFLPFHLEGTARLPRYDLRPVRPKDLQAAANALRAFLKEQFFAGF